MKKIITRYLQNNNEYEELLTVDNSDINKSIIDEVEWLTLDQASVISIEVLED